MGLRNLIHNIYFDDAQLSGTDYHRSRTLFIFEASLAVAIFSLTSGAFLAGFAEYLGANDQFNGIIAAIPALAGIIQVFSPMVFEKLARRKFLISISCLFFRLLLGFMVFIPLIAHDTALRLGLLAGTYFAAYLAASFITPAAGNWIMDLTPENMRGSYFGKRDSYTLAFNTIITLVMGKVMDVFRQRNDEYAGFVAVFSLVAVFAIVNFIFISSVKEPAVRKNSMPLDIKSIFAVPVKNKSFRKVIVLFFLWNIALQVGGPFFSVYMVTGLKLEYTYIMIFNLLSSTASVIAVRIWGRLADMRSWSFTTKLSIGILAVVHLMWFFINTDTAFILLPPMFILGGIAWAGINISLFNIQFEFAPEEGRTVYLGFNAAVGGIVGFSTTLIGSLLVGALEGLKFNLLGFNIGNMQAVFGISGLLLGICVAYIHCFIRNNEKGQPAAGHGIYYERKGKGKAC